MKEKKVLEKPADSGVSRRQFLKYGMGGMATLVVGSSMPWIMEDPAYAAVQVQTINFRITDAMKEMVTHNIGNPDIFDAGGNLVIPAVPGNDARCYHWIYKEDHFPAECPGPNIFTTKGDTVKVVITNELDEPHSIRIRGMFNSGPVLPGQTVVKKFTATKAGSHLYFDDLNAPVNRMMGLHGAFIVMPRKPALGHKFTPYSALAVTPRVQKLFDHLGTAEHWPGLSWQEGDPLTDTPAFRQYVWVLHEANPILFAEVGNAAPGTGARVPATFIERFVNDPYADTFNTGVVNRKAHFFTINGQSGHFAHSNPFICPHNRVGEPCIIRVVNAGLHTHSLHIHANHVYLISFEGVVQKNLWWVDTSTAHPLGGFEWLVPYMRPPDIPNLRGIGRADTPKVSSAGQVNGINPTSGPHPVWPPTDEINTFIPAVGQRIVFAQDGVTPIDLAVQLSPLCYPMHSHSEATQGAQGGNYNCGMISGINFIGDRNTPGSFPNGTFPNAPTVHGPNATGPAAGPEGGV